MSRTFLLAVLALKCGGFCAEPPIESSEPLFFTGETKESATARLLRIPSEAPKLTSPDGMTVYDVGRDFAWESGSRLMTLTANSRIPFKTTAELHPPANSANAYRGQRGSEAWMFYGPGRVMRDLQPIAQYRSNEPWQAPQVAVAPDSQLGGLRAKLRTGGPLKLVVLGDSISTGLDSSLSADVPPRQPGYPGLVATGIEARFGSKVAVANLSKIGMDAVWGLTRVADVLAEKPDLVLVAFGMNDASGHKTPEQFSATMRDIAGRVRAGVPGCAILFVSPMTANGEWSESSPELYPKYAAALENLTGDGVACANVTAVWSAIEGRKKHLDLSGNGLNHPNDFGHRLYADVILGVIGPAK